MSLTDSVVRSLGPRDKSYKRADGRGLFLLVTPAGGKLWRGKLRFDGKEKQWAGGSYPDISLAQARDRWDDARRLLRSGTDPTKRPSDAPNDAPRPATFEAIARDWHARNSPRWKPHHAADVLESLERELFPTLGALFPDQMSPPTLLAGLRRVEHRGAVDTARRLLQRANRIFAYGIAAGLCTANPAAALSGALGPVVNGRRPAVTTLADARDVLARAEAIPAHPATRLALRLLAIAAVRPGEVRGALWTEFENLDGIEPVWRIPAVRMKGGNEHLVPLSRQAVALIRAMRPLTGRCPFPFPNSRNAHKPMSENALSYLCGRAGLRGRHVPHGFRSSFSTLANDAFPEDADAIEAVLAHAPRDRVRSAYNRGRYLPRRRQLLQWWADRLLEGMPEPTVLVLGKRR